ncbi:hypothetical protein [Kribbella endophytica]
MIVLRIVRALLLALSTAVVTLAQLDLPDNFWDRHRTTLWASAAILSLLILINTGHEVTYFVQSRRIREYDKDVRAVLSGAAGRMVTLCGVPWDQVAVRYFRRRSWVRRGRLAPVAAIMAGADVDEPQRHVKAGTGIVGTAFKDQEVVTEEWAALVRQADTEGRKAWEKRPPEHRYGLSWGQLQQTAPHSGMIASPTFAPSGRPNGCILISGELKGPDLESEATRRVLRDLAVALDRLGPPPRGWWSAHE